MINRSCENCIYFIDGIGEQNCCKNKNATISTPRVFIPKEELIRKDERNKVIELIENTPILIIDDNDFNKRYYGNKAIEMYRERLICRLKKIKIMEK